MSIFKTRIWLVAYNTEIETDDIDVLRKYKYHSIFKYMEQTDYKNFLKNVEYKIDKKTFQKLITQPNLFNSGSRWNCKNNRITPFTIEDHLTYVNLDMINDEAHLLKSEFKRDLQGCYFIEATWFTYAKISIDEILMILDGIHDGSNGGENTFTFNKCFIYETLNNQCKKFPTEICSLISEFSEDIYCMDISAMFPTTRTHSTIERADKIITIMKNKNNIIDSYQDIMNFKFSGY